MNRYLKLQNKGNVEKRQSIAYIKGAMILNGIHLIIFQNNGFKE